MNHSFWLWINFWHFLLWVAGRRKYQCFIQSIALYFWSRTITRIICSFRFINSFFSLYLTLFLFVSIYLSIYPYLLSFSSFFHFCFLPCLAEIKGRVVRNEVFINGSSSKVVSQRQVVRSRIVFTNMVRGESSRVPTSLRAEQGRQQVVRSQVDSTSGSWASEVVLPSTRPPPAKQRAIRPANPTLTRSLSRITHVALQAANHRTQIATWNRVIGQDPRDISLGTPDGDG